MTEWETIARELLWGRLLDKADRVNELTTVLAIDLREGRDPGREDLRRLRAATDDLERSLDEYVEPITKTSQQEVDAKIEGRLGD